MLNHQSLQKPCVNMETTLLGVLIEASQWTSREQKGKGLANVCGRVKIWLLCLSLRQHQLNQLKASHINLNSASTHLDFSNIEHSWGCRQQAYRTRYNR